MTVVVTWTRRDVLRKHRIVMIRMDYSHDVTSLTVPTGLKKIYTYDVSPTSRSEKYVKQGVISGGTITLTVTNITPDVAAYLFVTAIGL